MHKLPKSALNGIFRCETVWEGFSSLFSKNGINFIVRNHKAFILSLVLKELVEMAMDRPNSIESRIGKRSVQHPPTTWTDDLVKAADPRQMKAAFSHGDRRAVEEDYVRS